MKRPRISDLKVEAAGTRKLRAAMAGGGSVKITINVDAESLAKLKALSADSGVPYQRLLNRILRERLSSADTVHARLDRIERAWRGSRRPSPPEAVRFAPTPRGQS